MATLASPKYMALGWSFHLSASEKGAPQFPTVPLSQGIMSSRRDILSVSWGMDGCSQE